MSSESSSAGKPTVVRRAGAAVILVVCVFLTAHIGAGQERHGHERGASRLQRRRARSGRTFTAAPDGRVTIFWADNRDRVRASRAHEEYVGAALEACPRRGPALSIGADGAYHLVWYSGGGRRCRGVFYARATDEGRSFSTAFHLGTPRAAYPSVLAVGRETWTAWLEYPEGETAQAWVARSRDGGAAWSAPFEVTLTKGASDHPFLVAKNGAAMLSWFTEKEGLRLIDPVGAMASRGRQNGSGAEDVRSKTGGGK